MHSIQFGRSVKRRPVHQALARGAKVLGYRYSYLASLRGGGVVLRSNASPAVLSFFDSFQRLTCFY